jgi:hypothetical protein
MNNLDAILTLAQNALSQDRAREQAEREEEERRRAKERLASLQAFKTLIPDELQEYATIEDESEGRGLLVIPGCEKIYFSCGGWQTFALEPDRSNEYPRHSFFWNQNIYVVLGRALEVFELNNRARQQQEALNEEPKPGRKLTPYERAKRIVETLADDSFNETALVCLCLLAIADATDSGI